ncbi:MAG: inositol monophosphatase family protein [Streptococcaceae bacterium]|jgi:myo-inositol-1(or 4)-monophosphatase|nr:inositol monophosphatase family protein [Streptococcaceae bacterium]
MTKKRYQLMKEWLVEARLKVLIWMNEDFAVEEKSNRSDLVTEVDRKVQDFLVRKITQHFPEDEILAEESGLDQTSITGKAVWVIDPIDGTLNFATQRDNFAMLVGYYQNGIGQFGFIYDVMKNKLFSGGRGFGVFLNEQPLSAPVPKDFSQGLIGVNSGIYRDNYHHVTELADQTLGVRMIGSAGLEFCSLLEGKILGYISFLCPWDYAAGIVLTDIFGFSFSDLDGNPPDFKTRQPFMIFQNNLYDKALEILQAP